MDVRAIRYHTTWLVVISFRWVQWLMNGPGRVLKIAPSRPWRMRPLEGVSTERWGAGYKPLEESEVRINQYISIITTTLPFVLELSLMSLNRFS